MTIENLFDIQSEITRQIVNAVKGKLTEAEQISLAQVPTTNQQAYEAYLQARAILNRADYSQERYIEAQSWVEKAVPERRDRISGTNIATSNAYVLALTGHRDEALAEIERLLIQPSGFIRWLLYLHPTWDFFRDDERFNTLIRPPNLKETEH